MAHHRHKRETNARRFSGVRVPQLFRSTRPAVVAAPLAVAATLGAVSIGVLASGASTIPSATPDRPTSSATAAGDAAAALPRTSTLSRGSVGRPDPEASTKAPIKPVKPANPTKPARQEPAPVKKSPLERLLSPGAVRDAIAGAETQLWTTESLNLWTGPTQSADQTGTVEAGEKVLVTGREYADRVEIVWQETGTRWVTAGYLSDEEPSALGGECTNGTSVPDGVSENIKKVHAAVCAAFPDITTYGTFRNDGEHSQGLAVDIMVTGDRGTEIADFVREYSADLGVDYVIWAQQIWSVERGGEGWRGMEDRGSTTANHFDHVHVTVF